MIALTLVLPWGTVLTMISRQGRTQTCAIAWRAGWANGSAYHRTPKARESILDHRTTIGCAVRAGKLYTLDFQPVGHDIPIDQPPPRHWNCRSILVPMSPDFAPPGDGQDPYTESLDAWLKRQPERVQDELLGPTRAALWRSGAIDARGLLGRGGETLSVAELTALHSTPETQIALWWRKPSGNVTVGRVSQVVGESIGATDASVSLSAYTRKKQLSHHSELGAADYARLPSLLASPMEFFPAGKARHVAIVSDSGSLWIAIVKADANGKLFLQSFRRTSTADIDRVRNAGKKKGGS